MNGYRNPIYGGVRRYGRLQYERNEETGGRRCNKRDGRPIFEQREAKRPATVPDLESRVRRKLEEPVRVITGGAGVHRMREFFHTIGLRIQAGPCGPVKIRADFAPLFAGWSALRTDSGAGKAKALTVRALVWETRIDIE